MAKHTPGPWGLETTHSDKTRHFVWSNAELQGDREDASNWCVATVNPRTDSAVLDANAALIAAAPDLLNALQAMLHRLDHHGSIDVDNYCLRQEYDICRAAITRATGAA